MKTQIVYPKTCLQPECDRKFYARGLCALHYQPLRKSGGFVIQRKTLEERFWNKVDKTETCWNWLASKTGYGYGTFRIEVDGRWRTELAHRLSYQMLIGPTPRPMVVDHLCCNPGCVNPSHMELVSHRENLVRGFAARKIRRAATP